MDKAVLLRLERIKQNIKDMGSSNYCPCWGCNFVIDCFQEVLRYTAPVVITGQVI